MNEQDQKRCKLFIRYTFRWEICLPRNNEKSQFVCEIKKSGTYEANQKKRVEEKCSYEILYN